MDLHERDSRSMLRMGKPPPIRMNMMVVGETGSGKTTFLKTLFKLYCGNKIIRAELSSKTVKTVKIEEIGFFTLATQALDCEIHLFDSPGYGDFINNLDAIETVKSYLEQGHTAWLESNGNQMTDKARNAADRRIHCVFYFIAPHRIKFIDKAFLKQLAGLAPLVLVIAKADTMTWLERKDHLIAVMELVEELEAECKMPIAFDFLEEEEGFIDRAQVDQELSRVKGRSNRAPSDASFTYNDFHDLSSSFVEMETGQEGLEESSRPSPKGTLFSPLFEPPHFSFRGKAFQPDADARQGQLPEKKAPQEPARTTREETQHSPEEPLERSVHLPLPKIRNAFAVVCDTSESGKREFPWGSVDIYNEAHSDFRRLQRLVFESDHIVRLRELTQEMSMALNTPRQRVGAKCFSLRAVVYALSMLFVVFGWAVVLAVMFQYVYLGEKEFRALLSRLLDISIVIEQ